MSLFPHALGVCAALGGDARLARLCARRTPHGMRDARLDAVAEAASGPGGARVRVHVQLQPAGLSLHEALRVAGLELD